MQTNSGPAPPAGAEAVSSGSFEAIYREFGGRVINLAYRMTGDADASRDLAQEVWIKVYQHYHTFEGRSDVYTWIHRITVNHVLNHLKRQRRVRWMRILDQPLGSVLSEEEVSRDFDRAREPSADQVVQADERSRAVWNAIQSLDPKYRVPLVLHHYDEMSYQQVAESMDLSLAAVESRIHRARKQLMRALGPLLDEL